MVPVSRMRSSVGVEAMAWTAETARGTASTARRRVRAENSIVGSSKFRAGIWAHVVSLPLRHDGPRDIRVPGGAGWHGRGVAVSWRAPGAGRRHARAMEHALCGDLLTILNLPHSKLTRQSSACPAENLAIPRHPQRAGTPDRAPARAGDRCGMSPQALFPCSAPALRPATHAAAPPPVPACCPPPCRTRGRAGDGNGWR